MGSMSERQTEESRRRDREEALEILKLAIDDIERMKQQQWRDTYALLAVQGGLLLLFKDHLSLRFLFVLLSFLAGLLGAYLIKTTQVTLEQRFRKRRDGALTALGPDFIAKWGVTSQSRRYPYTCLAVLALGTAFTILLMVKFPPAWF
jgi:hypothetical protein